MNSQSSKNKILLIVTIIISKLLGVGKEMLLAMNFGSSIITDMYLYALSLPFNLYTSYSTSLGVALIPEYHELKSKSDKKEADEMFLGIFCVFSLISILISFAFFYNIDGYANFVISNRSYDAIEYFQYFSEYFVAFFIVIAMSCLLLAHMQINGKGYVTGLYFIPFNLLLSVTYILSQDGNVNRLRGGTFLAVISILVIQVPFALDLFRIKPRIFANIATTRRVFRNSIPIFLASSCYQLNLIVDRVLASRLEDGSITALNYSGKVINIFTSVVLIIIASFFYPKIVAKIKKKTDISTDLRVAIQIITCIAAPVSIWLFFNAELVVTFLFYRGKFDQTALHVTSNTMKLYSIGIIGFCIREICNKISFANGEHKYAVMNGMLTIGGNLILSLILIRVWGVYGLAISSAFSTLILSFFYLIRINLRHDFLGISFIKDALYIILICIVSGYLSNSLISMVSELNIFVQMTCSFAIYTGFTIYILINYNLFNSRDMTEKMINSRTYSDEKQLEA